MSNQVGSGLTNELLSLGLPIGLAIISHKLGSKDTKANETKKKQKGGFLSDSLIIEAGLSVVPFALIGALETIDTKKDDKSSKNKK